jgi:transcriptional regulator with XRE-family HTH domain
MSELCISFGDTLRQLREAQRWSQETLAENASLNRSYVGEIERGKAVPSLITLEKLALALSLSMSDLVAQCERIHRARLALGTNLVSIAC